MNEKTENELICALKASVPEPSEQLESNIISACEKVLEREKKVKSWRPAFYSMAAAFLIFLGIYSFYVQGVPKPEFPSSGWLFVAGDAGNSRSVAFDCSPAELKWRTSVNSSTGGYKPLACNGLILIGTGQGSGGAITALDIKTGAPRWKHEYAAGDFFKSRKFPDRCIIDGTFFVTDGNVCRSIDVNSGAEGKVFSGSKQGWSFLSAEKERLIGLSQDGSELFAVNRHSGKVEWNLSLELKSYIPAIQNGMIFCQTIDGAVTAVSLASGTKLWKITDEALQGRAALQASKTHLAVMTDKDQFAMMDTRDGHLLWSMAIPGIYNQGAALGDTVFCVHGGALALNVNDGKVVWQNGDLKDVFCSTPTLLKNHLISAAELGRGVLRVLDAHGMVVTNVAAADTRVCDGAIVIDGMVFTVGSGHVAAYGAASISPL